MLCRNYLPAWAARYSAGDVVGRHHNGLPVATNIYQMDYLWGYLPATLIHEFTHARSVMDPRETLGIVFPQELCWNSARGSGGTDSSTGDQRLGNQGVAYQWQSIRQLAQENPDLAVNNSGRFARQTCRSGGSFANSRQIPSRSS